MAPKWIIYPPNAFNLSKDFIFFFFFFLFGSKEISLKKKKKRDDRIPLWKIDGYCRNIFLLEQSFYQESFLIDISKKKRRSLFFSRKRRITSLESLTLSRRLKELFTFTLSSISYRRRKNLRYCSKWSPRTSGGNFTAGLIRLEFSILSRSVGSFYRMENTKKKERKKRRLLTSSIRNKPLPS